MVVEAGASTLERLLSHFGMAAPVANPAACVRVRHQGSRCHRCLDVCPADALAVGETLTVDLDRCLGCGLCATACPTGALEALYSDAWLLRQVERSLAGGREVTFACARGGQASGAIVVPCLGALDVAVLVGALARGAEAVTLVEGPCGECPLVAGRKQAARTVAHAEALLTAFGHKGRIAFSLEPPQVAPPTQRAPSPVSQRSRREFLRWVGHQAVGVAATVALPPEEMPGPAERIAMQKPPQKQRLLVESLALLDRVVEATQPPDLPLVELNIQQECSGCDACSRFCPTGALRRTEGDDGSVVIAFHWDLCVACHLCVDICYKQAVTIEHRVPTGCPFPEERVLWQGRPASAGDDLVRRWANEQFLARRS